MRRESVCSEFWLARDIGAHEGAYALTAHGRREPQIIEHSPRSAHAPWEHMHEGGELATVLPVRVCAPGAYPPYTCQECLSSRCAYPPREHVRPTKMS